MTTVGNRLILAATVGAVVFLGAELAQAGQIVAITQREGVTVTMAGVRARLKPPSGGGDTVELPRAASELAGAMHVNAALIAAGALLVVLFLA